MSNVQSMLTIGAMILLAIVSLRFNSAATSASNGETKNKVYLTAFSLADNLIEEIKGKSFDQTTINFPTTNPASLTPPSALGPDYLGTDSAEVYPKFNDVDDYNGFKDTVTAPYFETYYISCSVQYVSSDNPDAASSTQTFYKKATITVSSPYLDNSVSLSSIFTLK
ncbi:MAG: hypothetical protein M1480_15115 [Bacteroidetes bacterium]|nr:hypothetical protein [Bacteroidota bacterium]